MSEAIPLVGGHTSPGFEAVRNAFAANFVSRGELGARAAPIAGGRRSSTSGAAFETGRRPSRGSGTPW